MLVVGGTGAFGSHLVRGLVATADFHVVIGGRDRSKSEAFASELRRQYPGCFVDFAVIDRDRVDADALRLLDLFAVVDAAGPFQGHGYDLPKAAIAAGVHYVDLADARDFVAGFAALDEAAKRAGVVAVAAASSTPALSNAALDRLTAGWRSVDTVEVGISPGNRAPRGLSVVSAALSYVGRPDPRLCRWTMAGAAGLGDAYRESRCRGSANAGCRSARRRTSTFFTRASRRAGRRSSAPGSSSRSCTSDYGRRRSSYGLA